MATASHTYDVFLSFRGEDTRNNFIGHLYDCLKNRGIRTFMDESKLKKGKAIAPTLAKAIEESKFSLVVFSKNYAFSTWCLNELEKIVECNNSRDHTIIPIFFDVDPSEVRYQKENFGKALAKHEQKFNIKKVQGWRAALKQAANIKGWTIANRSQSEVIKEIVRHIMVEVKPAPDIEIPDCVVGIDTHLSKIESFSFADINSEEVQMIGIYGVRGTGKTILAKKVYHDHKSDFEFKSIAEGIKHRAKENYQIVEIQKAILSEILGETDVAVYNAEDGAKMMEDVLSSKRVLLLLDDVDNELQLEKLARRCNWFGPGSRIIITTRKESLLRRHKVQFTCEMKAMGPIEALQLFSWHAFKRNEPRQISRELTNAILSYTKGIPLALVKLGSVLSSKYVSYQHCEVDGENKLVGDLRTLVRKKLNKMFKRGQRVADSTGRLDKTLEQILREAMDDISIKEKCSEVEREDDDSLEKEEESENSSESEEESEEESSEDKAKRMTNKPSSDSRIVASSSQVSNGYNYEHGKELIQQNPYATNFYGFGTSRVYHHNYPMTIPGYYAPPIPTYIPPIPPIHGYYPMVTPMRLGTSHEYSFCPAGESGCHCQDCAMKISPEFRRY